MSKPGADWAEMKAIMTGVIATIPRIQFSNSLGLPLAGGKLSTYLAGTTTPVDTFLDQALTIKNENPIELDSTGSAVIWLDPAKSYKFLLKNKLGVIQPGWPIDNISGASTLLSLEPTLGLYAKLSAIAANLGSSLMGFIQSGIGAVQRTVQAELRERVSITQFGCVGDGATNNAVALEKVASYLRSFVGSATVPKLVIPPGTYCYDKSPNWAIQGLTIEAQGNAVFKHTGEGHAFVCDGGEGGPGISRVQVRGNLRISGNANSNHAIYIRAVHHSFFEMSGRDVTGAILATHFTVCNEYRVKCTSSFEPFFSVTPSIGILASGRGVGEQTAACTYYNPIMEGISGYGIVLDNAGMCTFIGGTSEGNGGGISLSEHSTWNNIVGLDMEANSDIDINCLGSKNTFENCLAMTAASINATRCRVIGGTYNALTIAGERNLVADVDFGNMGGAFIDNGVNTIRRNLYNLNSASALPDSAPAPVKLLSLDAPPDNTLIMGSDDQIGGGPATDISIYKYGAGSKVKLWAGGAPKIIYSSNGIGFNGNAPLPVPSCGAVGTDLASTQALANQLRAILIAYGLANA